MAEKGTDISKAAELIKNGDVLAIPTETVYGLAANALDISAVKKIFRVKGRPNSNPLIIHIADRSMLERYVSYVPPKLENLLSQFWPGPLTVLFEKKATIPDGVNAGLPRVAVRVPQHKMTLELLQNLDLPLAAPSANPFGYISPTCANHVEEQLGDKIPYILDGGACEIGLESTIVGLEGDHLVVYRLGGITIENLTEHFQGIVKIQNHKDSSPDAPGMLPYHYAPKTALIITEDFSHFLEYSGKIGLIYYSQDWASQSCEYAIQLDEEDEFVDAGRNLYNSLHQLDAMDLDLIIIEKFPNSGLGRTINDRLSRAGKRPS